MSRIFFYAGLISLTAGCVTAPQTRALMMRQRLEHQTEVLKSVEIQNVPFVDQSAGECGPATLTMAMNWAGHPITVDQISSEAMTPEKKGSLQEDLISASRREGMMAVRIDGTDSLIKELAAGHPVIIFENLGLSWYKQWHYALVYGYDLKNVQFIQNSGHDAGDHIDMSIFERSWKLSDYWGLVVLPPSETSAAASEIENMKAAAGLEQAGRDEAADLAYHAVLKRWPTSLGALVGLGNLAYKKQDFKAAVGFLKEAQTAHPDSEMIAHNLRVAEAATHKHD
jgi:hypothetical protein